METIILVSVLSTLGVVAVIISIVVAFIKLRDKVGVNEQKDTINDLHRLIEQTERKIDDNSKHIDNKFEKLIDQIHGTINIYDNNYHRELDELRRLLDLRCDKLDEKINLKSDGLIPKTEKQILND
jgi:predicted PurR-regulated permease PerM